MHWVSVQRPNGHVLVLPFPTELSAIEFCQTLPPEEGRTHLMEAKAYRGVQLVKRLNNEQ